MSNVENSAKRVLIVDDDEFLLNMYAIKMKNAGYEPSTVTSGQSALEKLRAGETYNAIVFDIVMPSMNGFEFAETIKKERLDKGAALVALTNQGQQADIDRGKKLGINGYIVKASSIPSEVVKELAEILDKQKKV